MKVLITGSVGTGKTSIAPKVAKMLRLPYFDVSEIISENPSVVECVKDGEKVVKPSLKKLLTRKLPSSYVIDTHLAEYAPEVDVIVILRCEPRILAKRMKKRGYSKGKIRENVDVEIIDYFSQKTKKRNVVEFDTSKGTAYSNAKKIVEKIKNKKWNKGKISWDKIEQIAQSW